MFTNIGKKTPQESFVTVFFVNNWLVSCYSRKLCPIAVCREVLRTDLAFFLDSSSSLGTENFKKTKDFVKLVANAFDVSPANTHVSVATYGQSLQTEFDFIRYTNKQDLFNAIDAIPYRSERFTYIDDALLAADQSVFTAANNARADAFRVRPSSFFFQCHSTFS